MKTNQTTKQLRVKTRVRAGMAPDGDGKHRASGA